MSTEILTTSRLKLPGAAPDRKLLPDSQVLTGTFALLLFCPLAFGAVEPWSIFLLEASAVLLFCWWLFLQVRTETVRVLGNPLFLPMLSFGAIVLLQIVFGRSVYQHDTITSALLYLAYALLAFLVCQTLNRGIQARVLACVITGYGALVAVFALLQGLSGTTKLYWIRTPRQGGWIYGPYVNHNHYAGLMELLLPIPLVISLTKFADRRIRIAAIGAATIMAGTIFLSGSRGGMLACTIQLSVLATMLVRLQRNPRATASMGAFLILTTGLLVWVGGGQLADRLSTLRAETSRELSGGARWTLTKDSLHMAGNRPILGWGLGTFPTAYPQYRSFYTNLFVNEAHNDYAQVLVETGAAGFGIVLWFICMLYRRALRKLENWTMDINGSIALACLLGCTGILVHSFVDFNLEIPANAALFYVFATIAASPHTLEVRQRVRRMRRSNTVDSLAEAAPES